LNPEETRNFKLHFVDSRVFRRGRMSMLYVVTALQNGVSLSPERALVVALVAVGMFVVGIGLRSAQTADT
jgi:hypothetical protein